MSKIFLSYRRNDVPGSAGRLYDRLLEYFADDEVFLDVDSIEPGADFIEALAHAVPNSAVVLVLMGKDWLDALDEQGRRKIDNPSDFVRAEVTAALAAGVRVIPVLIGDARMPPEHLLPDTMQGLARLNAAHLNHRRFYADVEDLITVIDQHLHGESQAQREKPKSARRVESGSHRRFSIDQARKAENRARSGRNVNLLIAAVLIVILVLLGLQIARQDPAQNPPPLAADAAEKQSLAVLPFDSLSADPNSSFFADGIADELLTMLDGIEGLRLASRTSTFALRGQGLTVPELARRFNVNHVLAGAVRQEGGHVRISVQLVDARSDRQIWADSFDREVTDLFAIQEEIATAIAGALQLALGEDHAARRAGTDNPSAYSRYLQGLGFFRKRGGEALERAVQILGAAVQADPQFAQAAALLAASYAQYNYYVSPPMSNAPVLGLRYAKQALAADPENGLAHAVLGYLLGEREQWIQARDHVEQSLSLEPRNDLVRLWAAIHFLKVGELERGLAEARVAHGLDPDLGVNNSWLAIAYALNGLDEQARLFSRRASERGHRVAELAIEQQRYASPGSAGDALGRIGDASGAERQMRLVWLWHPQAQALRSSEAFSRFAEQTGWTAYWTHFGRPGAAQVR